MKLQGKEGRSGFVDLTGTPITKQTAAFEGGIVQITKKAVIGSYFDTLKDDQIINGQSLPVGAFFKLDSFDAIGDNPLTEGDEVVLAVMNISCWTTDIPNSASRSVVDQTTQCDWINGSRDIFLDKEVTETGTINGLFMTDSEMQRVLEGIFTHRSIEDGGKATWIPQQNGDPLYFWHTRREMSEIGEKEITIYRKIMVTSFEAGQPASGNVPFNFGYETMWRQQREEVITV